MEQTINKRLTVADFKKELAALPDETEIFVWDHSTRFTHHPEQIAPIIAFSGYCKDGRVMLVSGAPASD